MSRRDPARVARIQRLRELIAVRGGYGSAQVLPLLDPDEMRAAPKPFIGYSDLTVAPDVSDDATADWWRFTVRCSAGRLGRGRGRLRSRLVRARALSP